MFKFQKLYKNLIDMRETCKNKRNNDVILSCNYKA